MISATGRPGASLPAPRPVTKITSTLSLSPAARGSRQPVVVEASINPSGRVYDYRVVSGPVSADVHDELNNLLLMSVFAPARMYGQPVASHAILSFTSIAVHG